MHRSIARAEAAAREIARDPASLIRPCREIVGYSAVLLPFTDSGVVDWDGFSNLVGDTVASGLVPAVNMDTGYANLIDDVDRDLVLDRAAEIAGSGFAGGAFVLDRPGDRFDPARHQRAASSVVERGGVPVMFQSYGMAAVAEIEIADAYRRMTAGIDSWIAFELAEEFADFGRIYTLQTYAELLSIESCIGAKHSSLHRIPEWERLVLRDELRPGFKVFTGNDLAIDMVRWGSDYLLGLSACAPDLFALRDSWWRDADARVFELDDALAALGAFVFREPVPAYKHDVAMFLELRGRIGSSEPHPASLRRPGTDREVLAALLSRCLAAASTG